MNGHLYLYNLKGIQNYNKAVIEKLKKIDFYQEIKKHFVELEEEGNHKSILKEHYKIYFNWNGTLNNHIEIQFSGKKAIEELSNLAKSKNWSIMIPFEGQLINEEGFNSLEDFLNEKYY